MNGDPHPIMPPVSRRASLSPQERAARQTEDVTTTVPRSRRTGSSPRHILPDEEIELDDYDLAVPQRLPTSARRYQPVPETRVLPQTRWRRFHRLVYVGLALFLMFGGWLLLSLAGVWWQHTWDDWHYGTPRTFQVDAVVGHNHDDAAHPSHFLALNLHRHVLVIELPAGDANKAIIYIGPTLVGDGQDSLPVTLSFQDTRGSGRLDLVLHLGDQLVIFLNDGTKFVTPSHF